MKSDKAVTCSHCRGTKVVRNGIKKTGRQNHLCKECRKQFQTAYVYRGCVLENRDLVLKMLCRGSGAWDCAVVTGISHSAVLALIKGTAGSIPLKPKKHGYHRVQIDEQSSYLGQKEKKVWMLYAYSVEEDEIIAFTLGKRSA